MLVTDCGGCRGLGSHRRWCPALVGKFDAVYGPISEQLNGIGDTIGSNNPGLANKAYALSADIIRWLEDRRKS